MIGPRSSPHRAPAPWENVTVTSPTAPRRIAYQGEPGANSHLVCKRHYPDWESVPCASFEDVFATVSALSLIHIPSPRDS